MADGISTTGSGHPDLNLTPDEKRAYAQLFKQADPDGVAVSGDVAVRFFEKTRLPPDILGQIWQIADTENRGFLTPSGFHIVLRLIGHAQAGRAPSLEVATQPGPLPRFDGMSYAEPLAAQDTGPPASPTSAGPLPIRVPALTPDKVSEYSALFGKSGAENGYLSGVVAKQIFERARLPNEVLGRIWNLSDSQGRGALDVTEFVIAMHLLASFKSSAMRGVPNTLPPGLFEAAARKVHGRVGSGSRPASAAPAPALPPQFTGFQNARPQSPISRQQVSTPLSTQSTGEGWLVTPTDKIRFDQVFAGLDKSNRGFITGDQAVEFFGNARLSEETLAQIWDLSDINSTGQLSRDEFAVAMYLIRQQRGTRDGRGNLPPALTPALVPPSMRKQQLPPSQPTAPAFENATVTQPRSAADDLFGLDAYGPPPAAATPASPQVAHSTGGSTGGPFANPRSTHAPASPSTKFKPFVPSSFFGQSMAPQITGFSTTLPQNRSIPASNDLLEDTDPEVSKRLTNETSELGNLSNQVSNLSKQTTEIQGTRAHVEQELSQNSQQKREFESRLSQLRSLYEQEVKEVKALQEQLAMSKNDTKRLQSEMAMINGSHQDLTNQHQQITMALQADQRENAGLKDKMRQLNAEVEQLKPQLEKLKSDARQQKGLVAINKKQLATNEAERDRIQTEIATATKENEEADREAAETAKHVENSNLELEEVRNAPRPTARAGENIASPAPSTGSNPYFRRAGSDTVFSPPIASPPVDTRQQNFDNIFGPSFAATGATATTPETSFGNPTKDKPQDMSSSYTDSSSIPHVVEPPAPPPSAQVTSASLPFRAPLDRQDSISSSVKVAPPASRLSPADTPRALTPSASTTSPMNEAKVIDEPVESYESAETPTEETAPTLNFPSNEEAKPESREDAFNSPNTDMDVPGAFPRSETPQPETSPSSGHLAALAFGAGGATLAAGAAIAAATHSHGEKDEEDEKDEVAEPSSEGAPKTENFDDLFGGPAHQRTPSAQVADFDSAFAEMKKPATNGAPKATNEEFPAIKELDDDHSDDSEAPIGFDDDFNAKSPPRPPKIADDAGEASGKQPELASAVPAYLATSRPGLQTASSNASSLPGFESQTSPPTYGDSVPGDNATQFPPEFKGLLPSREDPTSPTSPPAVGSSHPGPIASPLSYGPEVAKSEVQSFTPEQPKSKPSPFDFDSAFAGMTPARVEEDDEDDDDDLDAAPRAHHSEFDPTFDSSPIHTRSTTAASNFPAPTQAQAQTSIQSSVTNGQTPAQQTSALSDFYSFNDSASSKAATMMTPAATGSTSAATATSSMGHDWDAIFAGIDQPSPSTRVGDNLAAPLEKVTSKTKAESIVPTPEPSPGVGGSGSGSGDAKKLERPVLGRAITQGTEHDDPILKRLTSMGWSREESLKALEKFDYNIDKAADYLTFRN